MPLRNAEPDPDACQQEIARAITDLLLTEPFFGHLLGGVVRIIDDQTHPQTHPQTHTAAVSFSDGRFCLHINDIWFRRTLQTRSERVAVLKHEALHLVLRHLLRYDARTQDRFRFGLAADLVVNQLIGRWRLPPDGILLQMFPSYPPDQSHEVYNERLCDPKSYGPDLPDHCHSDHRHWGSIDDPTSRAMAEVELVRLVQQAVDRSGGQVPGNLREWLSGLLASRQPTTDWRRVLRQFCTTSSRTRRIDTLRRPSRRYGSFPGLRTRHRQRLILALDTSGSIRDEELSRFFAEVDSLHRLGAEITVVECDTEVQRSYLWAGRPPAGIHGRGGTRFEPLLQWLHTLRWEPDACLYLTDGHSPAPITRPPCPLLWVLTRHGTAENLRFGRTVRLER